MIRQNFFAVIFIVTGIMCSTSAAALQNSSPLGISIVPPVQFPNSDFSITGLRLGLVSLNREVRGLDLALLGNMTKQNFKGVAIAGLFNYNSISAEIIGLQVAGLANINGTGSKLYGVQIGAFNKVTKAYGLQLGLVNVAHELNGIQIGLINFNAAGPFKASPIINAAF